MHRALLAMLVLLAGCTEDDVQKVVEYDCAFAVTRTLDVAISESSGDTQLDFQLASCQADGTACLPFCQAVVERELMEEVVSSCEVAFSGDTATLTFVYTIYKPRCDNEEDIIVTPE